MHEGELVKKGEVLLRLDPLQYQIAVQAAKANVGGVALDLDAEKLSYHRMLRDADAKQAQVQSDEANFDRFANLVKSGGVTRAEYDNARFQLAADRQALDALKVGGAGAVGEARRQPGRRCAHHARLPGGQVRGWTEAQRELDHTVIYAPFDGIVTQVDTVQPGMYLAASTAAFGIISTEHVWVEANPKETELTWVKPGDPVDVDVDTYPGRSWKGEVESIAPNSGSEFSVLPAQNTSGNWVKVVQRIPVRIRVDRQPGDPDRCVPA